MNHSKSAILVNKLICKQLIICFLVVLNTYKIAEISSSIIPQDSGSHCMYKSDMLVAPDTVFCVVDTTVYKIVPTIP